MITYYFPTNKNPTLQQIVQAVETVFSGLKADSFQPNPYPIQNTQIQVHGYVGITQSPNQTLIIVGFFESQSDWVGYQTTQNNVTVNFVPTVYSNIPTQTQIENVLSGAGLI